MLAPSAVDFGRHDGLLNHDLLATKRAACIGLGGAAGLVQLLTRCGISQWTLIDFDRIAPTNPATQAHDFADCSRPKAVALADRIARIDPHATVTALPWSYDQLKPEEREAVWNADLVLAMTDQFATQAEINREAVARGVDCISAICYIGCEAVEVTGSFADSIADGRGCHRCHTKRRYDAYAAGFKNPSEIPSHALVAEYLNVLIAAIVLGRLHARAGSNLRIAEIGRAFAQRPCLISRLVPSFGTAAGEAFGGLPPQPFSTSLWPLDTPQDFVCPDCGTRGSLPSPCPSANPGPGATAERS